MPARGHGTVAAARDLGRAAAAAAAAPLAPHQLVFSTQVPGAGGGFDAAGPAPTPDEQEEATGATPAPPRPATTFALSQDMELVLSQPSVVLTDVRTHGQGHKAAVSWWGKPS